MRTSIRQQFLGLTTAALAVGALSLTGSPAQAVGGVDGGRISPFGDVPTSADVVAFGSGDALAAWTKPVPGGTRVFAAIATDGVWGDDKPVTFAAVTNAHGVQAVANDAGDLAVVWNQTHGGEEKVRGARLLANGTWDGSALLSPAVDLEQVSGIQADMDGAGRVHVAYEGENDGVHQVHTTMWAKGSAPQLTPFSGGTSEPSIDVNPAGDVLLSFHNEVSGGVIQTTRRNAAVGWVGPKSLPWVDNVLDDTVAVIADSGQGAIMMGGLQDGQIRAVVTKVGATGTLAFPSALSAASTAAPYRDLAISPNGTLQATWSIFENGTFVIRGAVAKPGQDFGVSAVIEPSTTGYHAHRSLITDRGARGVAHTDADQLTLRHRTNPALPFGQYDAGATDGAFAAATDREGNVVTVGVLEDGFNSYVHADFLDQTGPTGQVDAPGAVSMTPSFPVSWSMTDSLAGVKHTDLIVRSAAWNGGFGNHQVVANNVTASSQQFAGVAGSTHCFEVQGVDKADNLGFRSTERCTTVPLDDTALAGKKWKRKASGASYAGTVSVTKDRGRKLVLPGVHARDLALLVTKAKRGGAVKVMWNGKLLKRISLKGKGSHSVQLADLGSVQTGTLKIKVVSKDGKKVTIDGLVAAK